MDKTWRPCLTLADGVVAVSGEMVRRIDTGGVLRVLACSGNSVICRSAWCGDITLPPCDLVHAGHEPAGRRGGDAAGSVTCGHGERIHVGSVLCDIELPRDRRYRVRELDGSRAWVEVIGEHDRETEGPVCEHVDVSSVMRMPVVNDMDSVPIAGGDSVRDVTDGRLLRVMTVAVEPYIQENVFTVDEDGEYSWVRSVDVTHDV